MPDRIRVPLRQRLFALGVVLIVFLFCTALVNYLVRIERANLRAQLQESVHERVSALRGDIEYEVNTTLNLTMGALVYVSANPDLTQAEFADMARRIIQHAPYIRNIGLAKDNVISHIYPLEGNESAIGLNYLAHARQRDAVLHAIAARKAVIAGPVKLVQGGRGLVSRIPIFLDDEKETYWGMTSVVLDLEMFLDKTGINEATTSLRIALKGEDAKGHEGAVFFGEAGLFAAAESDIMPISLPEGAWLLAAAPIGGWAIEARKLNWVWALGLGISTIICVLLYSLLISNAATRRAKRIAEQANEDKSRFFTNMTHELRTPLTTILGVIRLINSGVIAKDSPQGEDLLSSAERNCKRLNWLINDILDLKKLESGKMEFHKLMQPVLPVIVEAIDDVHPYAADYNITLQGPTAATRDIQLNIDSMRIQQAVVNLLSNAIKYSPPNTDVDVQIKITDNYWRLEVSDAGEGVPDDKLETIFTEFGQATPSKRTATASTGLGLSISRHIVHSHAGNLGCYNRPEGGATFFIELPLATAA
ncbi:hypothetical protein Tel_07230 [Candidatus Tenderia electrophaga]|jgi:two-component system sensor histidine kinase ChiS|uniref:histidine kinase n=1 Tax=Candidatus Tenderia electrophaga TaxID=1748243 RepID=A0A0S2TCW3_9GAMM|nr:hypothetical protein Tel_07230 [Candidatus Tenderia electrophaga]